MAVSSFRRAPETTESRTLASVGSLAVQCLTCEEVTGEESRVLSRWVVSNGTGGSEGAPVLGNRLSMSVFACCCPGLYAMGVIVASQQLCPTLDTG